MPDFNQLLNKYLCNQLTEDELQAFLEAVQQPGNIDKLGAEVLMQLKQKPPHGGFSGGDDINLMFEQMLQKTTQQNNAGEAPIVPLPSRAYRYRFIIKIAAACLLLLIGLGAYFWFNQPLKTVQLTRQNPVQQQDVAPGGNKATLTLSDGTTIDLTDAANGELAQQGNTSLVKKANGELIYQPHGKKTSGTYFNTMTTPRGGQYKLLLPDGTNVWLNASSSIKYPAVFNSTERRVFIEGEAYFEVAHQKGNPFIVSTAGAEVHVTGTHFNVNAYSDESFIKTTLLEGAVTVKKGEQTTKLKPGEQVDVNDRGLGQVKTADTEEVVAWKNGLFSFNGDDLPSIMRQLARWYNLEVYYEGPVPKRLFAGKVFRNMNLSETLKVFELSNVHFRIEGNKLTVIP